jgi:hypothetical protein
MQYTISYSTCNHSPPPGMTIQSQSHPSASSIRMSVVMECPPIIPHWRDGSLTAASTTLAPNFFSVVVNIMTSLSSLPVAMGIKTCFCDSLLVVVVVLVIDGCVVFVMIVLYAIATTSLDTDCRNNNSRPVPPAEADGGWMFSARGFG